MKMNYLKQFVLGSIREKQKNLFTQIPGYVKSFDSETQLAQVQIGIVGTDEDGTFSHSVIINCPVHFSGGSDWSIEHSIDEGDEGMIIFSQRCIDGWLDTGGIAKNPVMRFHDKQDACFIPGFRSAPNAISNFENDGIRLSNDDGTVYAWLKSDGTISIKNESGYVEVDASGNVTINGVIFDASGNITMTGMITTTGAVNTGAITSTGAGVFASSVTAQSFVES